MFYIANGLLSAISDNVFVATVYIGEVKQAFTDGVISRAQFDALAVAINTGTNIPKRGNTKWSMAAFLFLLTSSIAPLINLSYVRMVKLALPYTIYLTTGYFQLSILSGSGNGFRYPLLRAAQICRQSRLIDNNVSTVLDVLHRRQRVFPSLYVGQIEHLLMRRYLSGRARTTSVELH